MENPRAIRERLEPEPHMEVVFWDRVEFWSFKDKKIGESKIHAYREKSDQVDRKYRILLIVAPFIITIGVLVGLLLRW